MIKFLAFLALSILAFFASWVTLHYGWGLNPRSWPVIIFMSVIVAPILSSIYGKLLGELSK